MITLFYASLLALLMVVLALRIAALRGRAKVALGDGGNPDLHTRIRVFGNFIEWVPMILILMLLIERSAGSVYFLHAVGIVLIAARILHALSLRAELASKPLMLGRFVSTVATISCLALSAIYGLILTIPAL